MIEVVLRDYLNSVLPVPVYLEIPKSGLPASYVTLEKTGSSRLNHINRAVIAIQSIAPSMYEAAALNEEVKQAMDDAVSLAELAGAHLNTDYNFTDTTKAYYRYQAVYDLVHY